MSERELRKAIDRYMQAISPSESQMAWDELEEALADEPDVVGLLRDVYALLADAQYQDSEDILGLRCDYTTGITHAYNVLRDKLEKLVRLTETGWEYVDD